MKPKGAKGGCGRCRNAGRLAIAHAFVGSWWVTNERCWHGDSQPALCWQRFTWERRALDMLFQITKYQPVVLHANGLSLITKCFLRKLSSNPILFHVFNINLFICLRKAGHLLLCCCTAFVSVPRGVRFCAEAAKPSKRLMHRARHELAGGMGGPQTHSVSLPACRAAADTDWGRAASPLPLLAPHSSFLSLTAFWSLICYHCLSFNKCEMAASGHHQSMACYCLLDKLGLFLIFFFFNKVVKPILFLFPVEVLSAVS